MFYNFELINHFFPRIHVSKFYSFIKKTPLNLVGVDWPKQKIKLKNSKILN